MHPLIELQSSSHKYFKAALKIKDKNADIITFDTNDSQDKLLSIIENHYAKHPNPKTRPTLYIIILKARQQGMSTATEGVFFKAITIGMPGDTPYQKTAMVISYDEDSAQTINEMSDRFYQHLPNELKPMKRNSRGKGLILENPTNVQAEFEKNPGLQSKFIIDTANNLYAGSGKTINYVHISELPKWGKPEETMKSLMQSVPDKNAIVVLESTANGAGDYFHQLWQQAENGENDYIPLFLPWFTHKEYTIIFQSESDKSVMAATLDEEEKQLIQLFNVTLEQLNWRRNIIKNKCKGSVDTFHQEYPSTAEEAFLTSGRPRFDIPTLREYLKQCVDGQRGHLESKGGKVNFILDANGYIEVWHPPKEGREYFIGGDVAKGLIQGDYSAAPVYDSNYNMQALWHGHIDPDLFGDQLDLLGRWYNEGLIAPEENNHGLTTINRLKINEYWNLYKRTTHDKVTDTTSEQLGFYTTEQTKKLVIDNLARLIRERKLGTKSKRFIQECLTYVIGDDGKTNAQQGSFDDIVMGSAIILLVMDQFITEVQSIISPQVMQKSNERFVRQDDGRVKHISEIEDERGMDDDGWGKGWFG
jgi:hypothetical protein